MTKKKKKYQPSASAQLRRENLKLDSAEAKRLIKKFTDEAETQEQMLYAASLTVNQVLKKYIYKIDHLELKPLGLWKKEGFKLITGAKNYTIWGAPKDCEAKIEGGEVVAEVKAEESKEESKEEITHNYELFPMCILYPRDQVETWEEYHERKAKENESKEDLQAVDIQTETEQNRNLHALPTSEKKNGFYPFKVESSQPEVREEKKKEVIPDNAIDILDMIRTETFTNIDDVIEEEENDPELQARIDEYQERKQAKADRYRELADKNKALSSEKCNQSIEMVRCIPMGQPILVGHHSERGHRALLSRSDNTMRKSIEHDEKASYYENKAANAESNNTIYSDDPEALKKLKNKLKGMEESRELMKNANKIVRKKNLNEVQKVEELEKLGYTQPQALDVLNTDSFRGAGFPSYSLSNLGQNIKTVKDRIKRLEAAKEQGTTETVINGVRVVDNVEVSRLQLFFDGKPEEEVRKELKHNGFRWSPRFGAWQSYRGRYQNDRAKTILNKLDPQQVETVE